VPRWRTESLHVGGGKCRQVPGTDRLHPGRADRLQEKVRGHVDKDLEISDYGAAFSLFQEEFLDILDKKTTPIILDYGRTNFLDPEARILDIMREHCRRVIWLKPEPERLWGVGDSAIASYRPFCDDVRSCQNVNKFKTFITSLVL